MTRNVLRFHQTLCLGVIMACTNMVMPGCETMQSMLADAQKPTVSYKTARLENLSIEGALLAFDVEVSNPYNVALPLTDMSYMLSSAGKQFLAGKAAMAGTVPAKGSRVVTLPANVRFADALAILTSITPGSVVPYSAALDVSVDAPGVGPLTLPLRAIEGEFPVPIPPLVSLTNIAWDSLSLDAAKATLNLNIVNRNQFAMGLQKMNYALSLGGHQIVSTSLNRSASFVAGGTGDIAIPISFSPRNLGLAAFNIFTGKGSSYDLVGDLNVSTPFGPITLPFQRQGDTTFKH
ncbi:MAG TPA: LEA type 2 family protein [Phycisphaerales bacterium]|nr:LEA type 2 family protein [Phycisphaerales bacterium]HRQ74385.1 LEA type 2 family protein [Phycisphaerales bacterium]